jgi:hypothetical protein
MTSALAQRHRSTPKSGRGFSVRCRKCKGPATEERNSFCWSDLDDLWTRSESFGDASKPEFGGNLHDSVPTPFVNGLMHMVGQESFSEFGCSTSISLGQVLEIMFVDLQIARAMMNAVLGSNANMRLQLDRSHQLCS